MRANYRIVWRRAQVKDVAIVGCGQFGFTTIGYFLTSKFGARVRAVYDTDRANARKAGRVLGALYVSNSFEELISDDGIKYVYIASNHASHVHYAELAVRKGKIVHIEKPLAVTSGDLDRLLALQRDYPGRCVAGYNRPFSSAVSYLRDCVCAQPHAGGISLNCFVAGHVIGEGHWYRNKSEGTRVCGNAGHWIDLFIHVCSWRSLPLSYKIHLLPGREDEPDDNFSLSISTDCGDIFNLMLTSRHEPFEGIRENISFQCSSLMAEIYDFRRMEIRAGSSVVRRRYFPKDVGHERAILQAVEDVHARSWKELEVSARLTLEVAAMVVDGRTTSEVQV